MKNRKYLKVIGNKIANGIIKASGSKNAALPIIAASLFLEGEVILNNVPDILDVRKMLDILTYLNVKYSYENNKLIINAKDLEYKDLNIKEVSSLRASYYLIPILIIFLVLISLKDINVIYNYNNVFTNFSSQQYSGFVKSILYACYNCILLIPVLVNLIKYVKSKKNILVISIINFIIISILSLCVYNLLLIGNEKIFCLEMPIIEIVKKYGNIYKNLYIIMIAISIFTTAISTGYSFLNNFSKSKKTYKRNLIIISVLSIFLSQISFSVLVNLLYPVLGFVGIVEIILILKK